MKRPFLTPVSMGKYIRMRRLKNWKARLSRDDEKIKQKTGIEWTFALETNIQNQNFSGEYHSFFSYWNAQFQHMLGWESRYVCHVLRNEMQGI